MYHRYKSDNLAKNLENTLINFVDGDLWLPSSILSVVEEPYCRDFQVYWYI